MVNICKILFKFEKLLCKKQRINYCILQLIYITVMLFQFYSEAAEAESWMKERKPPLTSSDLGKDEDSVQVLMFYIYIHNSVFVSLGHVELSQSVKKNVKAAQEIVFCTDNCQAFNPVLYL